jgi:hypothetical protein
MKAFTKSEESMSVMRHLIPGLIALLVAAPLAGCGPKKPVASAAAQPPFSIDLSLDPTPPHVGSERFTVTVRDGTGAPVTGAKVSILPSYEAVPGGHLIPRTGMGGISPTLNAVDGGDGTYHAEMILAKPVYWTFIARATVGDTVVTVEREVQVQ